MYTTHIHTHSSLFGGRFQYGMVYSRDMNFIRIEQTLLIWRSMEMILDLKFVIPGKRNFKFLRQFPYMIYEIYDERATTICIFWSSGERRKRDPKPIKLVRSVSAVRAVYTHVCRAIRETSFTFCKHYKAKNDYPHYLYNRSIEYILL